MQSYSELDEAVFNEFKSDKPRLHSIAVEIKKVANDEGLKAKILLIEEDDETLTDGIIEGKILYKLHKLRERDTEIVFAKKRQAMNRSGHLECEVCVFDFEKFYGELGLGYIECHHRTPLSQFKAESKTTLHDLALVCSNCHRMLHRSIDTLSVDDLKMKIKY